MGHHHTRHPYHAAGAGVVPHPTDNHHQVPALDVHDHLVRPAPPLPTLHRLIVYPRATTGTPLAHTHYYSYTPSGHTHRYVQYLGFYSKLNVPWPAGLMSLFKGFSFFNLSLEAIHLTCGGLSYTDIWMLQAWAQSLGLQPAMDRVAAAWNLD